MLQRQTAEIQANVRENASQCVLSVLDLMYSLQVMCITVSLHIVSYPTVIQCMATVI